LTQAATTAKMWQMMGHWWSLDVGWIWFDLVWIWIDERSVFKREKKFEKK